MMRKGHIGTALVCGAVISVAACGGSSGSVGTFVPKGSQDAGSRSGDTSVSSSVAPLAHFPFPSSVHFQFQTPLPPDPQEAAAVRADEDFQLAYYYAVYSAGKDMSVLSYVSGLAPSVQTATRASVEQNRADSFLGTVRFYSTSVTVPPGAPTNFTVTSCVDNARMLSTDRRTGAVIPGQSTAPDKTVFLESDTLAPAGGSWKIVATSPAYYPNGAAKECYP
jgi:hypothetical protein